MHILDQNLIRKNLKLDSKTIIYNTSHEVLLKVAEENDLSKPYLEAIKSRPFDQMVLCISAYNAKVNEPYFFVMHITKDDLIFSNCFLENGIEVNWESEEKKNKFLSFFTTMALELFTYKKTKIYLGETKTKVFNKNKNKYKKSKITYISFDKIMNNYKSVFKTNLAITPHLVCGHWREILNKNGHDRNGNPIKDKTWVKPYEKGEGKNLYEKIRIWR